MPPRTARAWIEMGMPKSYLVGKYIESRPCPAFGGSLEEGYRTIHRRLRECEGLDGEDAFFRRRGRDTGALGMRDRTPAALAVPVHPFERHGVPEG